MGEKGVMGGGTQNALTYAWVFFMHAYIFANLLVGVFWAFKWEGVSIIGFKAIECVGMSIKISKNSGSVVYACVVSCAYILINVCKVFNWIKAKKA